MADEFICDFIEAMMAYQKENSVSGECIANSQYLYDCLRDSFGNKCEVKAVPFIVVGYSAEKGGFGLIPAHMCVTIGDAILDASYQSYKLEGRNYFKTIREYIEFMNNIGAREEHTSPDMITYITKQIVEFTGYAENIHMRRFPYRSSVYYNAQADYVEKNLRTRKGVKIGKK